MRIPIPNEYMVSCPQKVNLKTKKISPPALSYETIAETLRSINGVRIINEFKFIGMFLIFVENDNVLAEVKQKLPGATVAQHGLNKT